MLLELFNFTWFKPLAIFKETPVNNEFFAVLGKMGFALAKFVLLLAQLTLDHQAIDLVKDHSLDFDRL